MRFDQWFQLIYRRYDTDPAYIEAEKWAVKFFDEVRSHENVKSQAIYDMARDKYSQLGDQREILEKKAAGVIVFALTATTVLASNVAQGLWLNVSLSLIAADVMSSLMVLFPSDWPGTLTTREALESCDYNEDKQRSQLSAYLHCSIVGARSILSTKSNWLAAGYVSSILGTLLLIALRIHQTSPTTPVNAAIHNQRTTL